MSVLQGTNSLISKIQNQTLVRETIYRYGPIARKDIAKILSLTPPTITSNVSNLIKNGLVYECQPQVASTVGTGRPPIEVDFIADSRFAIGIDALHSSTSVSLVDLRGNIILHKDFPVISRNYPETISELASIVHQLIALIEIDQSKILGVGIAFPGLIDSAGGIVHTNQAFSWKDKPLAADLSALVPFPVWIENNAKARAIAENIFSKTLQSNFIYVFVSRGITCPLMIQNELHLGNTFGAGEIGHSIFDNRGPLCPSGGHRGCLNSLSSENAMLSRCQQLLDSDANTILRKICPHGTELTLEHIFEAQALGDIMVSYIIEEGISFLAKALAMLINFTSPSSILVDSQIYSIKSNQELLLSNLEQLIFGISVEDINFHFLPVDLLRGTKGGAALVIRNAFLSADEVE